MTPRYSDRLDQEAAKERGIFSYWQFQLGGLATAGMMATRLTAANGTINSAAVVGIGTGGVWLVTGALLGALYKPYHSGQKAVAALPKGSTREQLTRERVAEAEIESAEGFISKMRYLALGTDLFAAAYFMVANNNGFSASTDLPAVGAAILSGLLPFVFKPFPLLVAEQQRDYRKKIFAPVASFGLVPARVGADARLNPGLTLSWRF